MNGFQETIGSSQLLLISQIVLLRARTNYASTHGHRLYTTPKSRELNRPSMGIGVIGVLEGENIPAHRHGSPNCWSDRKANAPVVDFTLRVKMYWRSTTLSLKPKGAKTSTRITSYFIGIVTMKKLPRINLDRVVLVEPVFVNEERYEAKVSRTVLKPSQ